MDKFTAEQQDILANAYLLAREGRGQVIEDWAYPDAHDLAEQGWLRREFVDGELAWFWTAAAEHSLDVSALLTSAEGRQN